MSNNLRKSIHRLEELESRALLSGNTTSGVVAGQFENYGDSYASAYIAPAVITPTKPTQPSPPPFNGPFTPEQVGPKMPGIPQPFQFNY